MLVTVPTSVWIGGSVRAIFDYLRSEWIMFPFIAALPIGWKEWRLVFSTIALSGIVNVISPQFFSQTYGVDRVGLESPLIGNPNDFAGHLLMVLPIVVFWILRPPQIPVLRTLARIAAIISVPVGLHLILASGSRGALLALVAAAAYAIIRVPGRLGSLCCLVCRSCSSRSFLLFLRPRTHAFFLTPATEERPMKPKCR